MKVLTPVFAFILYGVFTMSSANAYEVADVQLAEVVPATAERPELKLNGAALRELYLLIKSYVGSLYLEQASSDTDYILNSESHKRMVFHVMMKKVGARRIANALQEALVVNLTKTQHNELVEELDQMLSYFDGTMHAGEEAIFDYLPGQGTRITINGVVKGVIPGRDYFRAMLAIWVGENPVGHAFKDEILGASMPKKNTQVAEGALPTQ